MIGFKTPNSSGVKSLWSITVLAICCVGRDRLSNKSDWGISRRRSIGRLIKTHSIADSSSIKIMRFLFLKEKKNTGIKNANARIPLFLIIQKPTDSINRNAYSLFLTLESCSRWNNVIENNVMLTENKTSLEWPMLNIM